MGYNLAIEYLADYEKTWMLDSFRSLNRRVLQAQSRPLTEWLFLEVCADILLVLHTLQTFGVEMTSVLSPSQLS